MNTIRQWQRFKALKRRELIRRRKGKLQTAFFSLAAANEIKRQPLNVSRVEVLDHEISLEI